MADSFTRRYVNFGLAAAGGMMLAPRRARAADFTLRHQHGLPEDSPLHKRALQMWAAIRAETGGRVDVQITRDGNASLDMLTKGDLAFMTLAGNGLASLMPAADVQATPYGFRNPAQVYRALDGELGDYLRGELRTKGLYAVPGGCFENGMHQITSATRPIRTAADFQGLKIRVPGSPVYQDFFKSMGAQIVTTNLTRTYDALKSGLVEAQDDPWDVVELFKFYEVQKYASITDHSWSGYNMLASMKVCKVCLRVQKVIETNTRKLSLCSAATPCAQCRSAPRFGAQGHGLQRCGQIILPGCVDGVLSPLEAAYRRARLGLARSSSRKARIMPHT
jgi:tripartite ATP-independent transporter DctP family solute receptor